MLKEGINKDAILSTYSQDKFVQLKMVKFGVYRDQGIEILAQDRVACEAVLAKAEESEQGEEFSAAAAASPAPHEEVVNLGDLLEAVNLGDMLT